MRVLVTGGAGYVGSTLVTLLLADGHDVRVFDSLLHGGEALLGFWANPGFEFRKGDVRDGSALREAVAGVDAVVHLAAIVGDPACGRIPELAKSTNLDASLGLLEIVKEARVPRLVFASTCSNYGKMPDPDQWVDETSELRPVSLYAETKVAVEQVLMDPDRTGDLCATALRFATVFGVAPRMRFDLTVNEFVAEMQIGKHLEVFGKQFWRPYIHVRDMAGAVRLVLISPEEKVRNEVFNAGSNAENYRKQDLVEMMQPIFPDAEVSFVHKTEDPRDYRVRFDKIADRLGFQITRTVPDGIQEVKHLLDAGIISDYKAERYRN